MRPALPQFPRLRAVGSEGATFKMLPEPGSEQHSLPVYVEADTGEVIEDQERGVGIFFNGRKRQRLD